MDGALHRYLAEQGVILDHPITIQMPVNLRKEGDKKTGNKLGIVLVKLAEPTDDPFVRLREIGFTLRNVRTQIDGGKLHFGIVATRDMEELDTLAQYMEEEFQNLENVVFASSE